MTDETYQSLTMCARSRIVQEWDCGQALRGLLGLIVDLSYALGQSWAVVPCLGDFAAACGVHKSTASRALRTAVQRGYLEILQRQGETLYRVLTETRSVVTEEDAQVRAEARERLRRLNEVRLQGKADVDGQARLPGVFDSEETEAPAAAFKAMTEAISVPHGTKSLVRPSEIKADALRKAGGEEEDPLARLMKTYDRLRDGSAEVPAGVEKAPVVPRKVTLICERPAGLPGGVVSSAATGAPVRPGAARMEVGSFDAQWQQMVQGLNDAAVHCLEVIREECRQRKGGESQFFQYRFVWRKRAKMQTRLYLEAAAVHKAMRLELGQVADSPGAFIYKSVEAAVKAG